VQGTIFIVLNLKKISSPFIKMSEKKNCTELKVLEIIRTYLT